MGVGMRRHSAEASFSTPTHSPLCPTAASSPGHQHARAGLLHAHDTQVRVVVVQLVLRHAQALHLLLQLHVNRRRRGARPGGGRRLLLLHAGRQACRRCCCCCRVRAAVAAGRGKARRAGCCAAAALGVCACCCARAGGDAA